MKYPLHAYKFTQALDKASKNDFSHLEGYLEQLRPQLRLAAQRGEGFLFRRHVEYLLIATTFGAIISWRPEYRAWSRRLKHTLSVGLPKDLYSSLHRINRACFHQAPKRHIRIRAPQRWHARVWVLTPVSNSRTKR